MIAAATSQVADQRAPNTMDPSSQLQQQQQQQRQTMKATQIMRPTLMWIPLHTTSLPVQQAQSPDLAETPATQQQQQQRESPPIHWPAVVYPDFDEMLEDLEKIMPPQQWNDAQTTLTAIFMESMLSADDCLEMDAPSNQQHAQPLLAKLFGYPLEIMVLTKGHVNECTEFLRGRKPYMYHQMNRREIFAADDDWIIFHRALDEVMSYIQQRRTSKQTAVSVGGAAVTNEHRYTLFEQRCRQRLGLPPKQQQQQLQFQPAQPQQPPRETHWDSRSVAAVSVAEDSTSVSTCTRNTTDDRSVGASTVITMRSEQQSTAKDLRINAHQTTSQSAPSTPTAKLTSTAPPPVPPKLDSPLEPTDDFAAVMIKLTFAGMTSRRVDRSNAGNARGASQTNQNIFMYQVPSSSASPFPLMTRDELKRFCYEHYNWSPTTVAASTTTPTSAVATGNTEAPTRNSAPTTLKNKGVKRKSVHDQLPKAADVPRKKISSPKPKSTKTGPKASPAQKKGKRGTPPAKKQKQQKRLKQDAHLQQSCRNTVLNVKCDREDNVAPWMHYMPILSMTKRHPLLKAIGMKHSTSDGAYYMANQNPAIYSQRFCDKNAPFRFFLTHGIPNVEELDERTRCIVELLARHSNDPKSAWLAQKLDTRLLTSKEAWGLLQKYGFQKAPRTGMITAPPQSGLPLKQFVSLKHLRRYLRGIPDLQEACSEQNTTSSRTGRKARRATTKIKQILNDGEELALRLWLATSKAPIPTYGDDPESDHAEMDKSYEDIEVSELENGSAQWETLHSLKPSHKKSKDAADGGDGKEQEEENDAVNPVDGVALQREEEGEQNAAMNGLPVDDDGTNSGGSRDNNREAASGMKIEVQHSHHSVSGSKHGTGGSDGDASMKSETSTEMEVESESEGQIEIEADASATSDDFPQGTIPFEPLVTTSVAWNLLMKCGCTYSGTYRLPGETSANTSHLDRFESINALRKFLCREGIPLYQDNLYRLTADEQTDLKRWIMFANIKSWDIPRLSYAPITDEEAETMLKKSGFRKDGIRYYFPSVANTDSNSNDAGIQEIEGLSFLRCLSGVRYHIRNLDDMAKLGYADDQQSLRRRKRRDHRRSPLSEDEVRSLQLWAAECDDELPTFQFFPVMDDDEGDGDSAAEEGEVDAAVDTGNADSEDNGNGNGNGNSESSSENEEEGEIDESGDDHVATASTNASTDRQTAEQDSGNGNGNDEGIGMTGEHRVDMNGGDVATITETIEQTSAPVAGDNEATTFTANANEDISEAVSTVDDKASKRNRIADAAATVGISDSVSIVKNGAIANDIPAASRPPATLEALVEAAAASAASASQDEAHVAETEMAPDSKVRTDPVPPPQTGACVPKSAGDSHQQQQPEAHHHQHEAQAAIFNSAKVATMVNKTETTSNNSGDLSQEMEIMPEGRQHDELQQNWLAVFSQAEEEARHEAIADVSTTTASAMNIESNGSDDMLEEASDDQANVDDEKATEETSQLNVHRYNGDDDNDGMLVDDVNGTAYVREDAPLYTQPDNDTHDAIHNSYRNAEDEPEEAHYPHQYQELQQPLRQQRFSTNMELIQGYADCSEDMFESTFMH